jgi:anti-sigma factor RsiW
VSCDEARPLLSAYVDGELDLLRSLDLEKHLATCASCSEARDALLALGRSLKGLREAPPEGLEERVRRRLRREGGGRPSPLPWGWAAAAVFAVALLYRPAPDEGLSREVVSGHIRSLLPNRLVDVVSSDRHTVKPYFHGLLDFAPPVPDLEASGFSLVGGRVDVVEGRRVAALVYKKRQHVVNVFVWPGRSSARALQDGGYSVLSFESGGFVFWAVSDLDQGDLRSFERNVVSALASP